MSTSALAVQDGAVARKRHRSARLREYLIGYTLVGPSVLFLALLIVYPSLKSVWDTIAVEHVVTNHGVQSVARTLTFDLYKQIFTSPDYRLDRKAMVFTLQVTVTSLVFLFLLCYPIAMYLRFNRGRFPSFLRMLCLIPLFIPTIISAFAFISFYQQGNFLDVLLQNLHLEQSIFGGKYPRLIDSATGIVLAEVWNNIPFTVLLIGAGLGEIDNALVESARDVGADSFRIFRSLLFPLTLRQYLIAFILAFIGIMGSYNIPYLLGPTLPQMIGPAMNDNISEQHLVIAEAEAVLTFVVAALIGMLYVVAVVRQRRR